MKFKKSISLKLLLSALDDEEVPYVSWKNNHQLDLVMSGNGDLDLFVPFDSRSKFFNLCRNSGWIEVINPVAHYPWVHHFYGMNDDFSFYHIHVYFKVVTGESWIKEYLLPLDRWMIENRIWSSEHNIWILDNTSQAYIFTVRHLLKGASISSRALYAGEMESYYEEWIKCEQEANILSKTGPIDVTNYLAGSSILAEELHLPKILTALSFRFSISPFLRYQWWSLPIRRSVAFTHRLVNKFFLKRKKLLPQAGLIIAISGVDGAGKTTMLKELDQVFDQFLTLERFHLGRPQGKFIELVWRAMGNTSKNSTMPGCAQVSTPSSIGKAFNGAVLAILRLRKARIAVKRANQGNLVLVDRWPTDQIGKMDGPRVIIGSNSGVVQHICRRVESWAYSSMPRADVCYFFVLPMNVAIERNRMRTKDNKETDEQISARFKGNLEYKPLARKTIRFDNSGDFIVKRKEFLDSVWHEIISRY
jgi:thymidylate kinase